MHIIPNKKALIEEYSKKQKAILKERKKITRFLRKLKSVQITNLIQEVIKNISKLYWEEQNEEYDEADIITRENLEISPLFVN